MIAPDSKFLQKFLNFGRKVVPRPIFEFFQPWYHGLLALSGAAVFGFPSRKLKVIGVTGTKGKSTTVYLIDKFLTEAGYKTAVIGSLGYKIGDKQWPNLLKMTLPGRWKVQKFLRQAVKAGCRFAVLEITSEGIKQKRHRGIKFDTAIFTNLEKEHIESHGSFENYYKEKQKLFKKTKNTHILNKDSRYIDLFSKFNAKNKIFYGLEDWPKYQYKTKLLGDFNKLNILVAAATAKNYGVSQKTIQKALDKIKSIPGRMEIVIKEPFTVIVDYAHTPDSLDKVYQTIRNPKFETRNSKQKSNSKLQNPKLICVLGAAGGGRDKWKRPEFGKIAAQYCDEIILTDEDPYTENPKNILKDIESGLSEETINNKPPVPEQSSVRGRQETKYEKILNRRKAIRKALEIAKYGDTVVITGKGSEPLMMTKTGPIKWDDREVAKEEYKKIYE